MWQLGGFDRILDAKYSICKKLSAVCGFSVATRLQENGI